MKSGAEKESFMLRHNKGLLGLFIVVVMVSLVSGNAVMGQSATTSLRGTVVDINGSSVPEATVTITNAEIGVTLTSKTDKDGAYRFSEVRPTTYVLTVEASGFATYKQTGLQLLVGTPATNDVKMQLASVATVVEVVTTSQAIHTQDATIGTSFGQTQIASLPFEGGYRSGILSLQPCVVTVADQGK